MMQIGYIAASITLLSWTVGTFAFTKASQNGNPASVNRVRLLFAFLILSVLVMVTNRINPITLFTTPTPSQYLWFGLSGFVGLTLGDYFAFSAYRILGGRRTSLFSCFAPGAALVAGWFLVDERIGWIGLSGMAVSTAGILLLILSRKEQHHVKKEGNGDFMKGILFGTLGAFGQGVGLVLAKKGFQSEPGSFHPMYATWIRMFAASFFVYLIGAFTVNLKSEFKTVTLTPGIIKPVLIGTLFGPVIGVTFSLLTAANIEASVAQTLFSLLPVTVLLTSVALFGEKVPLKSYLAVAVSIIGVLILVWRDRF